MAKHQALHALLAQAAVFVLKEQLTLSYVSQVTLARLQA